MESHPDRTNSTLSFVCCVEAGLLETQTVRMIQSLRRWGGCHADARVFAVKARRGVALRPATRAAFDDLQVDLVELNDPHEFSWFKFFNKPQAVAAAAERTDTAQLAWLDSDILIVREPSALVLADGIDAMGCPSDREMATSGPGDPYYGLWQANCAALGLNVDELPIVETYEEHEAIRMYWNGGVFSFRVGSAMSGSYRQTCLDLLAARNVSMAEPHAIGIAEQSAVALGAVRAGLPIAQLPYSHNYIMSPLSHDRWYDEQRLRDAHVVHYHGAMYDPDYFPTFVECLRRTHPDVGEWIAGLGLITMDMPILPRLANKALRMYRDRKQDKFVATCPPR